MPNFTLDLNLLLGDLKKFAEEYQALITLLAFVVPLIGIVLKIILDRQKNIPNLYLELVDVGPAGDEENVTFGLRATNLGEHPATHCRYKWTPRSSLIMTPLPAGFLILKGEPRRFEFTMETSDFMRRGLASAVRSHYRMLGWLEVTYYAGWGRWRRAKTAIVIGATPDMPVQLAKVPRPPWTDYVIPLKEFLEKRFRDEDIQSLDRYLQQCREYLEARGIMVELLFQKESLQLLFGELQRRGWYFSYGPGGRGHEVYARKEPGGTIRLSANTMVDAATLVLKSAIEHDEKTG